MWLDRTVERRLQWLLLLPRRLGWHLWLPIHEPSVYKYNLDCIFSDFATTRSRPVVVLASDGVVPFWTKTSAASNERNLRDSALGKFVIWELARVHVGATPVCLPRWTAKYGGLWRQVFLGRTVRGVPVHPDKDNETVDCRWLWGAHIQGNDNNLHTYR